MTKLRWTSAGRAGTSFRGGSDPDYYHDLRAVLEAQLDIQMHLVRDVLGESERGSSELLQRLDTERRRVLQDQSRQLWERMGARGRSHPCAIRLWAELAMALPDAVLVALCFELERGRTGEPVDAEALRRTAGAAYLRLLQDADKFLPMRQRLGDDLLSLAVAVTAVRMVRRRGHGPSWIHVDPAVREVVDVMTRTGATLRVDEVH